MVSIKIWVNATHLPFLELYELCLMVEAKIITLSSVVLGVCRGNTANNYKWGRLSDVKGKNASTRHSN